MTAPSSMHACSGQCIFVRAAPASARMSYSSVALSLSRSPPLLPFAPPPARPRRYDPFNDFGFLKVVQPMPDAAKAVVLCKAYKESTRVGDPVLLVGNNEGLLLAGDRQGCSCAGGHTQALCPLLLMRVTNPTRRRLSHHHPAATPPPPLHSALLRSLRLSLVNCRQQQCPVAGVSFPRHSNLRRVAGPSRPSTPPRTLCACFVVSRRGGCRHACSHPPPIHPPTHARTYACRCPPPAHHHWILPCACRRGVHHQVRQDRQPRPARRQRSRRDMAELLRPHRRLERQPGLQPRLPGGCHPRCGHRHHLARDPHRVRLPVLSYRCTIRRLDLRGRIAGRRIARSRQPHEPAPKVTLRDRCVLRGPAAPRRPGRSWHSRPGTSRAH